LTVSLAAVFILSKLRLPDSAADPIEQVDPFVGLPEELPPGANPPKTSLPSTDDAPAVVSPFGGLNLVKDETAWKQALVLGGEGLDLAEEAASARTDGDLARFKDSGQQAKAKLVQALDLSREWEQLLIERYGEKNSEARSVQRVRGVWRKRLVALKKTVGF
jgi:hypothetical protein